MAVEFGIWSHANREFDIDAIVHDDVFVIRREPLRYIAMELGNSSLKAFEVVIYRIHNGPWREYRGVIEHVG